MRIVLIEKAGSMTAPLTAWGHTIVSARDSQEAMRALEGSDPPDLVLVDSASLGSAALEIVSLLRSRFPSPKAYVVMAVPSDMEVSHLSEFLEVGCDDYVTSPIERGAFRMRLANYERLRNLHADLVGARDLLRFFAMHDPLTSMWNKTALFGHLYREVARAVREHSQLSVAMCDVDHFKQINDTHGHLVGDEILRGIAHRLSVEVRGYDIVSRYGGEEFALLFPGCGSEEATQIALRICHAMAREPLPSAAGPLTIFVSIGVASLEELSFGAHAASSRPDLLLLAADEALYQAKTDGRNRVVPWSAQRSSLHLQDLQIGPLNARDPLQDLHSNRRVSQG